ncbi:MAG: hypothetical protein VR65_01120 [Desulfobulbaceae bacterium BRH_c16a]|nr:MAG: hypothetical protein VR65_01120 [Desulfobulbaceae bacterium BRH_c16a]
MFNLVVTGKVLKFAEIRPAQIRLEGQAGTPLAVEVEILPNKDYPFTILGVQSQRNDAVRGELIEQCNTATNRCVIRVENLKTTSGRYADTLIVRTDNAARPSLAISVVGILH